MKNKLNKKELHITFHNPNKAEEIEKRLIQIIAQSAVEKALTYPQIKEKPTPKLQDAS